MNSRCDLSSIPGGAELIEWFLGVPSFHDAEVLELTLSANGRCVMRLHAWTNSGRLDDQGYFISENHASVSFVLEGIKEVDLLDLNLSPAIVYRLEISKREDHIRIEWDSSYGVYGHIKADRVHISFSPGKPE